MNPRLPLLLLLACGAALVFGLVELFALRFAVGDVYPPYSSLRSDPLGTMAFYESLTRLPGLTVRRDYSASSQLPDGADTTLLLLADRSYDWDWLSTDRYRALDQFIRSGGRLVITCFPQTTAFGNDTTGPNESDSAPSARQKKEEHRMVPAHPDRGEGAAGDSWGVRLEDRWGFDMAFRKLTPVGGVYAPVRVRRRTPLPLPRTLAWHSGVVLTRLNAGWQTIYARGTNAVLIERKFGLGSVVLATDSYFFSNEAMARDRHANLLAWLIGPHSHIVFDEAHFGIIQTSDVARLMRQYHLQGVVAGLILLAGLFIWKNSSSLAPQRPDEKAAGPVRGQDVGAGFINLLRRGLAGDDLLDTCFQEWKKSAASAGDCSAVKFRQAEALFQAETSPPPGERNPVRIYQTLCAALRPATPNIPTNHAPPNA